MIDIFTQGVPISEQMAAEDKKKQTPSLSGVAGVPVIPAYTGPREEDLRDLSDIGATRKAIFGSVLSAAQTLQPVKNAKYTLSVSDVDYEPERVYTPREIKEAILQRKSLDRRLNGTWTLSDSATGDIIERRKTTLARVPYLTDNGAFVSNGTKFTLRNQSRLLPGVYSRIKSNGEFESHVNSLHHEGPVHRYAMDPKTGAFSFVVGQSKTPLVGVLKALGASDDELREAWGDELYKVNMKKYSVADRNKLYEKLVRKHPAGMTPEEIDSAIAGALQKISFDPDVMEATMGERYTHLNKDVVLNSTKKLIGIARGEVEEDDRDNLAFQGTYGPEDLFAERLTKDHGRLRRGLLNNLTFKRAGLNSIKSGALTPQLMAAIQSSGLGMSPEDINPADAFDKLYSISRLGEGALPCHSEDTDVFTKGGWVNWADVTEDTLFAVCIGGELRFSKAEKLYKQRYIGDMCECTGRDVKYKVTPDHRLYCRQLSRTKENRAVRRWTDFRFERASEAHGKRRQHLLSVGPWLGGESPDYFDIPVGELPKDGSSRNQRTQPKRVAFQAWLKFLGRYLADGNTIYRIEKSQYKVAVAKYEHSEEYADVEKDIQALGFPYFYTKSKQFVIADKGLATYTVQFGISSDKFVPDYVKNASYEDRKAFFEAITSSDGYVYPTGVLLYQSRSETLRDDVVWLAISLGYSVYTGEKYRKNMGVMYTAYIHKESFRKGYVRNCPSRINCVDTPYEGYVYCASVPGGLLLTRYKGCLLWSGNSIDSIPDSAREVNNSHLLFHDPVRTPESLKAGADLFLTSGVRKGKDNQLYTKMFDVASGEDRWITPKQMLNKVVAVKSEYEEPGDIVPAFKKGKIAYVDRSEVQYIVPDFEKAFSPVGNLIPLKSMSKGQRINMGTRMLGQALPLVDREAPLVQSGTEDAEVSYEEKYAPFFGAVRASQGGVVREVGEDFINVQYDDGTTDTIHLSVNNPSNRKSYISQSPDVQKGDRFQPNQLLASSNVTAGGAIALGRNARVAMIPWDGANYEDAVVVSQSFADKMRSQHMYQNSQEWSDNDVRGKKKFAGIFPMAFNRKQLETIDDNGIVLKGTRVETGDPLILSAGKRQATAKDRIKGKGAKSFNDNSVTWDHSDPGIVTDVYDSDKGTVVLVKSEAELQVGDKLCVDRQTEVMTARGWVNATEIKADDELACLVRGELRYSKPFALHYYPAGGDMYRVSNEQIDLFVTCTHKMFVRFPWETEYSLKTPEEIWSEPCFYRVGLDTTEEALIDPSSNCTVEYFVKDSTEPVYGFTVAGGLMYVRRNGKACWTGNSGRYGNKGVISKILPDEQMPQTPDGPIEVAFNSQGVTSRTNPSQLVELLLAKIARKRGKPYKLQDFKFKDFESFSDFAMEEAKKYGVNPHDVLIDSETGRPIKNDDGTGVANGEMFVMKLHHSAEGKKSARAFGGYTADESPARGGAEGSKRSAMMHLNALISHGAYNSIRDIHKFRGQKNDEYWLSFMQGNNPTLNKVPMVYEKFFNELRASGINVVADNDRFNIMAMTNADVDDLSGGREVKNSDTIKFGTHDEPIKGGLFDPTLFGELGNRWAKINLATPILNPVMEDPARNLLGLTQAGIRNVLQGKEEYKKYGTGIKAIQAALSDINVDSEMEGVRQIIQNSRGNARDNAVRRMQYLKGIKDSGISPSEWILNSVPVLPPKFRPISQMQGSNVPLIADANYLYKLLIDSNDATKELKQHLGDTHEEDYTVYNAFKQITGLSDVSHPKLVQKNVQGFLKHVFGDGSSKFSTMQRSLLGTPVDLVARSVVTPNPDLDMDSIGIPEESAWMLFKPFIIHRLTKSGTPLMQAAELWESRAPAAKKMLLSEMDKRYVVADRAPVLHKGGVMAFKSQLVPGDTLQTNTLINAPFGLDFDGDTMNFHVTVTDDEIAEAEELLLPSKNLLSPADFETPQFKPSQEYVQGLYSATAPSESKGHKTFATLADAKRAYAKGEIGYNDNVLILSEK